MNEKTVDTSNIIKSIEDSVFKAMGLSDSFNRKIMAESIPSDKDKVIITLSLMMFIFAISLQNPFEKGNIIGNFQMMLQIVSVLSFF